MKRDTVLDQIENNREPWDFLVIGGGATGLGVAVDAAARGYRTLLVSLARYLATDAMSEFWEETPFWK